VGRFVQKDPVLGRRTKSHALFAGNSPVSLVDPTGLQERPKEAERKSPGSYPTDLLTGPMGPLFEESKVKPSNPFRQVGIMVVYSDPAGILNQNVFDHFERIVSLALLKDERNLIVKWFFKPGPEPGKKGRTGPRAFVAFVEVSLGRYGLSPASPGASSTGLFRSAIYLPAIRESLEHDKASDRDIFLANVLVHELVFHAIASEFDYLGILADSETGNALDLTHKAPQVEWLTKEGFLPKKATSEFIDEIDDE
jgi:hypothetical protein